MPVDAKLAHKHSIVIIHFAQLMPGLRGLIMNKRLSEICNLGARKYIEDDGNYRNPYPINSPEFNEFERGWFQSARRDDARRIQKNKIKPYSKGR